MVFGISIVDTVHPSPLTSAACSSATACRERVRGFLSFCGRSSASFSTGAGSASSCPSCRRSALSVLRLLRTC